MTQRRIVKINEELCNGCGKCVTPCAEGAISIVNGKAKVLREELCDGLGFCIGICPMGALSIEEREATEFNEEATKAASSAQAKKPEIVAKCFRCGKTEMEASLFPFRFMNRSEWVCARCLPAMIHG